MNVLLWLWHMYTHADRGDMALILSVAAMTVLTFGFVAQSSIVQLIAFLTLGLAWRPYIIEIVRAIAETPRAIKAAYHKFLLEDLQTYKKKKMESSDDEDRARNK